MITRDTGSLVFKDYLFIVTVLLITIIIRLNGALGIAQI
jgi:hypothetical protein